MSRVSADVKRRVCQRARGFCEYCLSSVELTGHDFTVDHVIPEGRGGSSRLPNLCWCCFWCNSFKQARTRALDSRTGQRVALFNPRRDNWHDHFRWSRDSGRIVGRTANGRATVKALRLNRRVLVTARQIWAQHDLHPPEI